MSYPDFNKKFFVFVEASADAAGGNLQQNDSNNLMRPIAFFCQKLSSEIKNSFDRELLAMFSTVKKF